MQFGTLNSLLLVASLALLGCDDEPSYSAEPGIEVCEAIVDECGSFCKTDPSEPEYVEFSCSFDSQPRFSQCADDVVEREGLQEITDGPAGSAISAARGVVVGYEGTCESALITFPVFCYGCKD